MQLRKKELVHRRKIDFLLMHYGKFSQQQRIIKFLIKRSIEQACGL